MKFDYFHEYWNKHPAWITTAKSSVRELYEKYEKAWLEEDAAAAAAATQQDAESSSDDEFGRFGRVKGTHRSAKRRKILSELDSYMEIGVTNSKIKDPLNWWLTKGGKWPILQRMAMNLFSIPAMSSECERVFSQTKRILTDDRNRMGNDTLEAEE
ncbi:HAT domain-containing protein, partial [Macrophomina phaseolina MS6]